MGIKENFAQAVRELTGGDKSVKAEVAKSSVDDLRRAVESEGLDKAVTAEIPAITAAPELPLAPVIPAQHEIPLTPAPAIPAAAEDIAGIEAAFPGTPKVSEPQEISPTPVDPFSSSKPSLEAAFTRSTEPSPVSNPFPRSNEPSPVGGHFVQPSTVPGDDGMADELTVISKNTVVEGNIRSFANMNIDGNIRGDIETTKNIELNGKVIGNLTCNNAQMLTSQIQGNIRMKGNILMGRDTLLIGDLVSTYAKVNGKVKGNMEVGGKAELKGDAVIFGDISASTITVDDGAIIQGYVSTTFLNKEESRNIFPEAISIAE